MATTPMPFRAAATLLLALLHASAASAGAHRATGGFVPISAYDDDPFAADAELEQMERFAFGVGPDGRPVLSNGVVAIEDESVLYRLDPTGSYYYAFAWNPWSPDLIRANAAGDFAFPDEPRFPLHRVERGPDGKIVLIDGLQHWLAQDLHRGMTTLFEAVDAAKTAAEGWSARELRWGTDGRLDVNAHAFIDYNAFYSPTAQALYFGVVPHRLPGEPATAPVKMLELATSWEIVAHEAGHALHARLKPNHDPSHPGFRAWSESLGDQVAMWVSLRDRGRALAVLAETGGDLAQSNSVTRIGESFAALVGAGTGLRDALHDKRVSDTSDEVHDRSQVLTGAAYRIFLAVLGEQRRGRDDAQAVMEAARVLGVFLMRAADFTPEDQMTLEDVAKAYLKVDAELFRSRWHAALVDEFTRRELLDEGSLDAWRAHEAALPRLWLAPATPDTEIQAWLDEHLEELGIGSEFGLRLQSVTRPDPLRSPLGAWHTGVRVELTEGRGQGATSLDNHGILVFRTSGQLADWHAPLPPAADASSRLASGFGHARALVDEARRRGLDQHGGRLALVRGPDGTLAVEVRVLRSEGIGGDYLEVFTPEHPEGERREILLSPVPPSLRAPVAEDVLE